MLRSLRSLERYRVNATDGDLGCVEDFLVDDEAWTIRYLVVDTGSFIGGRRVLVSPISFREIDWSSRRVHLALTKEKIIRSPGVELDKPVSRQHEFQLYGYYGYGLYWGYPGIWGAGAFPSALVAARPCDGAAPFPDEGHDDVHLRSINAVRNYHIHGRDGSIGHVDDFLIDDETWELRYLVIDTSNWWLGKKVLVPPQWATRVSWVEGNVYVNASREQIKSSPVWDGRAALDRSFEERTYEHYGCFSPWAGTGEVKERRPPTQVSGPLG